MRRILKELRPFAGAMIAALLLAALSVLATLEIPILTGRAVDCLPGAGKADFDGLFSILRQMCAMIAGTCLSQWGMNRINNRVAYSVTMKIRREAFEKLERIPIADIDASSQGDLISRLIVDADTFSDGLLLGFSQLFTGVMTIVGTVIFMIRIRFSIALVVIALTPLTIFIARFITRRTNRMFRQQAQDRGALTDYINERIMQQPLVRRLGAAGETKEEFDRRNVTLRKTSMDATFFSSLPNPTTRFVNSLIYASVGVAGAFLALSGGISVGSLTSFLGYASSYAKPFNEITGVLTEMGNALACAKRLFEIIDRKVPEYEEISETSSFDTQKKESEAKGRIEFRNVCFSYDKKHPLIEDLNLLVSPGQRIAIVGPTGAGKTTIVNLLMRFYEIDSGAILIDGMDEKTMTCDEVRSKFGMVLQETWLFSGTVLENLTVGAPNVSREEVEAAACRTHADEFIRRLPQGYDTPLSSAEGGISQGQRQLLCITRLMLALPPILILDEATSSIDTRTEQKIQEAFRQMMQGRTTFIVAHRLSTIRGADRILYLENGRVLEQGSHKELMEKNGAYARLYDSQFSS